MTDYSIGSVNSTFKCVVTNKVVRETQDGLGSPLFLLFIICNAYALDPFRTMTRK